MHKSYINDALLAFLEPDISIHLKIVNFSFYISHRNKNGTLE